MRRQKRTIRKDVSVQCLVVMSFEGMQVLFVWEPRNYVLSIEGKRLNSHRCERFSERCYPDLNWRPHPYQLARGFGEEYLLALLDPFCSRIVGKRVVLKTGLCRPVPGDTGVCLKIV